MKSKVNIKANFPLAWILLTSALAMHVIDEAMHNFLSFYNSFVININNSLDISLFPVFSFSRWLNGLITGIITLFALSYFTLRKPRWIVIIAYVYGIIMIANGLGHILGSWYYGQVVGGLYTSPLLLAGATYMIWSGYHASKLKG